jgi:hypothetical protein
MARYLRIKKSDALAGVGVALRGLRDSADVFPPLKSIVAAVVIVWEMSKVSVHLIIRRLRYNAHTYNTSESKVE